VTLTLPRFLPARLNQSPRPDTVPVRAARSLRRAALTAGLAYTGSVVGYALLRRLLGEREGWIELVDDLEPWGYLPAPAVAALGAAIGSTSLTASAIGVVGLYGLRWGHRFLRRTQTTAVGRPLAPLTVMTFNTLAWQREGHDLEQSILSANPDIVALQEIGPRSAHFLADALGAQYPHAHITESADSSGAAVLSRYPIRDAVAFRASEKGHWWQRMLVDAPAGPITFFNIHTKIPYVRTTHRRKWLPRIPLAFHAERRRREVEYLVSLIKKVDGAVIVCGDFNMTERSTDHRLMSGRLSDAYQAVGRGLGNSFPRVGSYPRMFPAPWPLLRLDYIWNSHDFQASWAYRGDAGDSDHHPIIVGLSWESAPKHLRAGVPLAASAV
jgi:endonuclease/exonuclease/phosphatase family metal-dependent hydrolase